MSIIGTNAAQAVAGLGQAERVITRDTAKRDAEKAAGRRVVRDEVELIVSDTEGADAIRSLKSNTDEETRDDKREHPGYTRPAPPDGEPPPSLDVQA